MGKNLKMSTVITGCVVLIAVLCFGVLYLAQSIDMNNTMRKTATGKSAGPVCGFRRNLFKGVCIRTGDKGFIETAGKQGVY